MTVSPRPVALPPRRPYRRTLATKAAAIAAAGAAIVGATLGIHYATTTAVSWDGSAPNGNLAQYTLVQDTAHSGAARVGNAASVTVRRQTNPSGAPYVIDFKTLASCTGEPNGKCRAEVGINPTTTGSTNLGSSGTWDFWIDFPKAGNGCIPSFWTAKQDWGGGPGIIVVKGATGPVMRFRVYHGSLTNLPNANQGLIETFHHDVPIQWDHWYHVQEYVKWGTTLSSGAYSLTVDGATVQPQVTTQTRPPNNAPYWKIGTYTHAGCNTEETIAGLHRS